MMIISNHDHGHDDDDNDDDDDESIDLGSITIRSKPFHDGEVE